METQTRPIRLDTGSQARADYDAGIITIDVLDDILDREIDETCGRRPLVLGLLAEQAK